MLVSIIKRLANAVMILPIGSAVVAPLIAPRNRYDSAHLGLWSSELPPLLQTVGERPFLLGADTQGRDMLSVLYYGTRISVLIGFASVVKAGRVIAREGKCIVDMP